MNSRNYFISFVITTVALLNLIAQSAQAQEILKNLTLGEALEKALSNNAGIRLAKIDEHIAAVNYKQTEAILTSR